MKTSANIATHAARSNSLRHTVDSLLPQVDEIRIYFNDCDIPIWAELNPKIFPFKGIDITDNAKFYFLTMSEPDEIYLTIDDDIIYPRDYVEITKRWLQKYPVISYHGKRINLNSNYKESYYYGGHYVYSFRSTTNTNQLVHIPGTGVMAIDLAKYQPPKHSLYQHPYQKMSDLVFAVQAAIDKQPIYTPVHQGDWLKITRNTTSICTEFQRAPQKKQIELVNKLIKLHNLGV